MKPAIFAVMKRFRPRGARDLIEPSRFCLSQSERLPKSSPADRRSSPGSAHLRRPLARRAQPNQRHRLGEGVQGGGQSVVRKSVVDAPRTELGADPFLDCGPNAADLRPEKRSQSLANPAFMVDLKAVFDAREADLLGNLAGYCGTHDPVPVAVAQL